jgi:hypothetical protein
MSSFNSYSRAAQIMPAQSANAERRRVGNFVAWRESTRLCKTTGHSEEPPLPARPRYCSSRCRVAAHRTASSKWPSDGSKPNAANKKDITIDVTDPDSSKGNFKGWSGPAINDHQRGEPCGGGGTHCCDRRGDAVLVAGKNPPSPAQCQSSADGTKSWPSFEAGRQQTRELWAKVGDGMKG